ncbi:MAG TPA: hypothetical protein VMB26_11870 [Candidatus Binataceae bacterium]|nr:hypothetical protein [Candidatus Binataceae bacterium]
MKRSIYSNLVSILLALLIALVPALAIGGDQTTISGSAEATLETDHNNLYLKTHTKSFQLAQFAYGGVDSNTVMVEGDVAHRWLVNEDIGANGDQTGTVKLSIHPINMKGHFDAPIAARELPGDEIKLESPSGINVITYGCCQESSAETELSLASLKTLYVRSGGTHLVTYTRLGKPALGRLIALYLAMTPADDEVLGSDPSSVALITLEGEGEVLQRIRVFLHADKPRETVLGWSTEMGWQSGASILDRHTVIDPAKPPQPVLHWKIGEREAIELPLIDDRLNLAAAKLPNGITMETLH